ncbi:MAG TPA: right-handed parallel beta-helix repeat-containing protein [Propionibacteriaceae bacterium]|jgi:hypothetical protein
MVQSPARRLIPESTLNARLTIGGIVDVTTGGDGVADDTTAVAAALAGISAFGGGTVRLSRPHVVSAITIPERVTLQGNGSGKLIHKSGSAASAVTLAGGGSTMRDLEVDGNAAGQTVATMVPVVARGVRTLIENCYVHDAKWDGIAIGSGSNHRISGCTVIGTGRFGITISATGVTPTTHCRIVENYVEASTAGALGIIATAHYVSFVGNTTKNHGGDGIAAYNADNRRITCIGNVFHNPGNHGIHLGGQGLVIADNVAENVGQGHGFFIQNDDLSTAYNAVIEGNTVEGVTIGEGIRVGATRGVAITGNSVLNAERFSIHLTDCSDYTVGDNTLVVTAAQTAGAVGINLLASPRGTVTGNTIRGINGDAILLNDNGGVFCQFVTITGNTISTCAGWGLHSIELSNRILHGSNIYSACTAGAKSLVGANNVASGLDLAA